MLKNIENYVPAETEFVLSPKHKEMYPATIFDGAEDLNEVLKMADRYFNAEHPSREKSTRKLDAYEISEIRGEYCHITENDLPMKREEKVCAEMEAKRLKDEAADALKSVENQIAELASRVKIGTKDVDLHPTGTMRMALGGNYVYYTWCNGKMKLAKVEIIPAAERRSIWSNEDKNREAMKALFGIEFPEVTKPIRNDGNEEDGDDDIEQKTYESSVEYELDNNQ